MKINITDWNLLRIVRLILGFFLVGDAIATKQWFFLGVGVFLLYQSVFNVGCASCPTDTCEIEEDKQSS